MNIGIFYGFSTGNTEMAANLIKQETGEFVGAVRDVRHASPEELAEFDVLLLGVSTWNIGEMQDDWADFLPQLEAVDLPARRRRSSLRGTPGAIPTTFWTRWASCGE